MRRVPPNTLLMYPDPASSYDTLQLLRRIDAGDEAAFTQLFEGFHQLVYHTALKLLHEPALADDIVQDVFLKVWLKRGTLSEIGDIRNWLFIVTRNGCKNALRGMTAHSRKNDGLAGELPHFVNDVETRAILQNYEGLIAEAMTRLTDQQKKVFELSYRRGMSRHEIADELGTSPNTVKMHLMRAMKIVRAYLMANMKWMVYVFLLIR